MSNFLVLLGYQGEEQKRNLTAHHSCFKLDFTSTDSHCHTSASPIRPFHVRGFGRWSGSASLHSGLCTGWGQLVGRAECECRTEQWTGVDWWAVTRCREQANSKRNHLELSTMYCTILSRTFSKRAVRTQMCLMAWAERGWGGRLVVDEPCLLRGSWPTLWVLLWGTNEKQWYREEVKVVSKSLRTLTWI